MKKKKALIIFAKYPREGEVKTRLAKAMGEKFAVSFYKACAENTFKECEKIIPINVSVYLFYADRKDEKLISNWASNRFLYKEQNGETLGERMENAFSQVFHDEAGSAIIIGTDLPDISYPLIAEAFEALEKHQVVIGPSSDGGYYLLGMNELYSSLFSGIKWSTGSVLKSTIEIIKNKNLSAKILKELTDIDEHKDLKKWFSVSKPDENNFLYRLIKEQSNIAE